MVDVIIDSDWLGDGVGRVTNQIGQIFASTGQDGVKLFTKVIVVNYLSSNQPIPGSQDCVPDIQAGYCGQPPPQSEAEPQKQRVYKPQFLHKLQILENLLYKGLIEASK